MKTERNWIPCRVCGDLHCNPRSSSICGECGAKEAAEKERIAALSYKTEEELFQEFLALDEEEKWRVLWRFLSSQ